MKGTFDRYPKSKNYRYANFLNGISLPYTHIQLVIYVDEAEVDDHTYSVSTETQLVYAINNLIQNNSQSWLYAYMM